jgi:hypothetical protein
LWATASMSPSQVSSRWYTTGQLFQSLPFKLKTSLAKLMGLNLLWIEHGLGQRNIVIALMVIGQLLVVGMKEHALQSVPKMVVVLSIIRVPLPWPGWVTSISVPKEVDCPSTRYLDLSVMVHALQDRIYATLLPQLRTRYALNLLMNVQSQISNSLLLNKQHWLATQKSQYLLNSIFTTQLNKTTCLLWLLSLAVASLAWLLGNTVTIVSAHTLSNFPWEQDAN